MTDTAHHDPDLLARATQPGRVRGIGVALWEAVLADPLRAGGTLRRGLREARALHSRERRLVSDVLYDLIRTGRWIAWTIDDDSAGACWDAAIAVRRGELTLRAPDSQLLADALAAGVAPADLEVLRASLGGALPAFLAASGARAPVCLRAHPDDHARLVRALGTAAKAGSLVPEAILLPPGTPTHDLPGRFEVQDEGSQWVVARCGPVRGKRVLDACAGAGGKSLALAAAGAQVVAVDVRARALDELQRRARAHGVRVTTRAGGFEGLGTFDVVLVDAPCTGTGTWRRHPELRWRLSDLPSLLATQAAILDAAWPCVRPGGELVYATCSVLRDEDHAQVAAFCARVGGELIEEGQLTPHEHGTDGFYVARVRRR